MIVALNLNNPRYNNTRIMIITAQPPSYWMIGSCSLAWVLLAILLLRSPVALANIIAPENDSKVTGSLAPLRWLSVCVIVRNDLQLTPAVI